MKATREFAAAVFAGGKSSRMGTDKAFLEIEGIPLWQRQLSLLRSMEPAQLILSANGTQEFPGIADEVTLVRDPVGDAGPLSGLVATLEASRYERVLVIAVDMPGLHSAFLEHLMQAGKALVFRDESGRFEPFPAVYPAPAATLARDALKKGRLALQELLSGCVEKGLMVARPLAAAERSCFQSWNRPSDIVERLPLR
jgi:molybdopterin-guanine dinucleotide biosynthesis protein A